MIDTGVIYCDDNLGRLALLPRESVDLRFANNRRRLLRARADCFRLSSTAC